MKLLFETWRKYLAEAADVDVVNKNMIGGKQAQQLGITLIDFDIGPARKIAEALAAKLGAQLGKELGRGSPGTGSGIVYEIRAMAGEGRDMVLKITQFPREKKGYVLARWKKDQLEKKNPKLASILPEVSDIVDTIYDFEKGSYLSGRSIKIYGIIIERLEELPNRVKEQLFGHAGMFKDPEAETEWIKIVTEPKLLIPALRETFGDEKMRPRDRYYTYFDGRMESGLEFEKEVLDLKPPRDYRDYRARWIPKITQFAKSRAEQPTTYSSLVPTPDMMIQRQALKLPKRLEGSVKIPQYPPESLKLFTGIKGAYPKGGESPQVTAFFNKLMALGPEGVTFWDTHRENVMMRPLTNEIVVSDVGLFRHIKD